jgi:hypothetical protein
LILDEIQSGMGRTGALFSYMQKGVVRISPEYEGHAAGFFLSDRRSSRPPPSKCGERVLARSAGTNVRGQSGFREPVAVLG